MFYVFMLSRALFAGAGFPAPKKSDFLKVRNSLLTKKTAKNEQIVKLVFDGN